MRRIAVVEDNADNRLLVSVILEDQYEIVEFSSGMEAIEGFRKNKPDVVILDLTLPGGMGGKEALKKLIEIDPTVNAIVSSGYATDATMSRYQDFGFHGVIAKPYEAAELGKIVHDTIESSRVNVVSLHYAG